ncbi:MAG: LOG family protein [Candidatus Shapirobacteria bacterium]|nr:LOG family protein [Candidatus Shapirobacteria bacterium]
MLSKTKKIIKRVAIFGDAEAKKTDQHFINAFNTAKLLAENGYTIVNGGGPGIMLAATLGAKAGGGKAEIVILDPKHKPKNYEGLNLENNKLADKIIKTKNYPDRLNKLIDLGDTFVIFNGGVGTLSEVGLCWEMAKFEYGKHEPLIFFGEQWEKTIGELVKDMKYDPIEKKVYEIVISPEEVLETIQKHKGSPKKEKIGLVNRIFDYFK